MLSQTVCDACPVLKAQPLCSLKPQEWSRLCGGVAPQRLSTRDVLVKPGQWPTFVYAIREGSFKLVREDGHHSGTVVETVFAGEWIGVPSLLENEPFDVTAEALEPSALCAVPGEDFLEQFTLSPTFNRQVVRQLSVKLDHAHSMLLLRSHYDAASRLAACLIYLDERRPQGSAPGVAMTKADLGQMIATAQETVFRLLTKFETRGLLRREDRRILLLNRAGLEAVAANPKNTGR